MALEQFVEYFILIVCHLFNLFFNICFKLLSNVIMNFGFSLDGDDDIMPRQLDHVVHVVRNSHELCLGRIAEDGVVGEAGVRHIEVEILGAIVLASPERDSEAYLAQRNHGSVGDADERPRWCQPLIGDLPLLERLNRDHVEARTPIKKCLGDGDVVDGGGAVSHPNFWMPEKHCC